MEFNEATIENECSDEYVRYFHSYSESSGVTYDETLRKFYYSTTNENLIGTKIEISVKAVLTNT